MMNNNLLYIQILASLVLIVSVTGCSERSQEAIDFRTEGYQFRLAVNSEETEYSSESTYPINAAFILEITPAGQQNLIESVMSTADLSDKEAAIYYLSYDLPKAMFIEGNTGEHIKPLFFHFERSFDLKTSRKFLVSFDLSEVAEKSDLWFVVDQHYFGKKPIRVNLNELALNQS